MSWVDVARGGALAGLVLATASCRRHEHGVPPSSVSASPVIDAMDGSATLAAGDSGTPSSAWLLAVRREQWDDAERLLDALPDATKAKPEVAYVRARVALERGDDKSALARFEGLEISLPLLASDIARYQADARLSVGPFAEAGEYFAARATPSSMLRAALAFERGKDEARARVLCGRVLQSDHKTRLQESSAHACRVRLADPGDRTAAADARWIATHAPDSDDVKEADGALARLDPAHALTGEELMTRAHYLVEAGRTDDALRVIDRARVAATPRPSHLETLRAKGDALYRAKNRHLEAARVLDECASAGGPHAGDDAFHAARALSRADKDDDAIYRLTLLARSAAGTTWGDEATFFVPYLHLLHGRWKEAARGFDEYAQKYPAGTEKRDAGRDRALAHLMSGDYALARKLFEELAGEDQDALGTARSLTMAALAALRDGDRLHAIARWTDVAENKPLSWPALVARARLAEIGAPLPPAIQAPSVAGGVEPLKITLPPPVDLLHAVGLDGDAEAALKDRESVVSGAAPAGRGLEALCAVYAEIGRARRRYQLALQIPAALLAEAPGPTTRWAWECAYATPFQEDVAGLEATEKLPESLTYAVMRQESSFDPDAVSPARAVGLLQLVPETAAVVAGSMKLPWDEPALTRPYYNLTLGVHYLHDLLERFKGQVPLGVAAYNAGHESLERWLSRSQGMDLDAFVERIPFTETRIYVAKVMGNLARYAYLRHGEEGVPKVVLSIADLERP